MNKYIPLHMSECYSRIPRKKIIEIADYLCRVKKFKIKVYGSYGGDYGWIIKTADGVWKHCKENKEVYDMLMPIVKAEQDKDEELLLKQMMERHKIIAPIERKIREQAEIDIKHALKPYR